MVPVMDMERTSIAIEAWRTVDEIKASPLWHEYAASRDALFGPGGPRDEIDGFVAAKATYEATFAIGKHHPDFKRDAAAFAAAKTALFTTPEHRRHAAALAALNAVLDGIAADIREILDSCLVGTKTHCEKR